MEQFKTLSMPAAMLAGFLLSGPLAWFGPLVPYLIAAMLLITYCGIESGGLRITGTMWILICVQVAGGAGIFYLVGLWDMVAAEAAMICVIAPTAASSVVIAGMLGGNVTQVAAYTVMSNIAVAIAAPVMFTLAGTADFSFAGTALRIGSRIAPLIVVPMASAFVLKRMLPKVHCAIAARQGTSFYLWTFALMVVTARTVEFIKMQQSQDYTHEILIAVLCLLVCLLQFGTGRALGRRSGQRVTYGQSAGQKNTVLAIWMAQNFLSPVSSIGPASYVLWQNIINSYQIWRKKNRDHASGSGVRECGGRTDRLTTGTRGAR